MKENVISSLYQFQTFIRNNGDNVLVNYLILPGLLICCLLLFLFTLLSHRKLLRKFRMNERLLQLDMTEKLETNLVSILEMIAEYLSAETYSFYIHEPKTNSYILKAIRHQEVEFGKVGPSYSGLMEYKKETYHQPLSLPTVGLPQKIQIEKAGEVPMLVIPIPEGQGVIIVGPVKKLSKQVKKALMTFSGQLSYVLHSLLTTHSNQSQKETAVASMKAVNHIGSITLDTRQVLDTVLEAILETYSASGVLFIHRTKDGFESRFTEEKTTGVTHQTIFSPASLAESLEIFSEGNPVILKPRDPEFNKLPNFFSSSAQTVIAIRSDQSSAFALFIRFNESDSTLKASISQLDTVVENLATLLQHHQNRQQLVHTSMEFLKSLVRMMDSTNPYTQGYSDLMSRYALVLALELGMSKDEIRDVGLAAFLSNIGVLGLSRKLYLKEGKFTENEFERMKLHSEVGATIVRVATGNERVASYILHHHERFDGNGYPNALSGEDIPLGARIIAVVQTFLAKINGRRYRHPLPFDQALNLLQTASGSQLDERVVRTLLLWFQDKQSDPSKIGRSLGTCWEMCCTAPSLCKKCPAYQKTDMNCWEFSTNLCHMHGRQCDTCMVRTEWQMRLSKPAKTLLKEKGEVLSRS